MTRRILLGILALLLGLVVLAVVIDETCSRNEDEWQTRFVDLPSGKVSDQE